MSSTIPSEWIWLPTSKFSASSIDEGHCPKRQSICELEGDASVNGLSGFMAILTQAQMCMQTYMLKYVILVSSATVFFLTKTYLLWQRFLISSLKCIHLSHKHAQISTWFSHLYQYGR